MRYPTHWLDELRARVDIVKVINGYVPLKKNGHRYVGLCPFHNETAPSFSVDDVKQLYHCFGCKAGGSVIQFIMEMERLSFPEAVAFLADQAHMSLPDMEHDSGYEKRKTQKERIYLANKLAAQYYHKVLWQEEGAEILAYLQGRGLSDGVIRRFGIGAAPKTSNLSTVLTKQGFTEEELVQAGLMLEREGRKFDMFRNRALFPIIDAYGNVLGFGGRAMGDAMPKYLNTGETLAFNKRFTVFAANLIRKQRNLSRILLVEGYMDVVALSQYGVEGVVATLGTALTPEQARLLGRYAPEVHIAYDGDSAGQKAILRGLDVLEAENVPAKVLDFPDGLDPDEFIRKEGVEAFYDITPLPAPSYRMLREKDKHNLATEEGRGEYAKACAEILRQVKAPIDRENYLRHLAIETGYSKEVLLEQMGITAIQPKSVEPKGRRMATAPSPLGSQAERTLVALLATQRLPADSIDLSLFSNPSLLQMATAFEAGETPASVMEAQTDEANRSLLSEVLDLSLDVAEEDLRTMAEDCMRVITKERLSAELNDIMRRLPTMLPHEQEQAIVDATLLNDQLRQLQKLPIGHSKGVS